MRIVVVHIVESRHADRRADADSKLMIGNRTVLATAKLGIADMQNGFPAHVIRFQYFLNKKRCFRQPARNPGDSGGE